MLRYSGFDHVSNRIDPVSISGWTGKFADASTLDFERTDRISLFYPWTDRSKDQRPSEWYIAALLSCSIN